MSNNFVIRKMVGNRPSRSGIGLTPQEGEEKFPSGTSVKDVFIKKQRNEEVFVIANGEYYKIEAP